MAGRAVALLLVLLSAGITGCHNSSDPRVLAAADSLVPPGSAVVEKSENLGRRIFSGPYYVHYVITDGGRGPDLAQALIQQAEDAGWTHTVRKDGPGGAMLRFERDDLRAVAFVLTKRAPVYGTISVRTADERDEGG